MDGIKKPIESTATMKIWYLTPSPSAHMPSRAKHAPEQPTIGVEESSTDGNIADMT